MTQGLEVYKHMLRAFTGGKSDERLEGIDSRDLLTLIQGGESRAPIRQSDLTQALDRVYRLQAKSRSGRKSSPTTETGAGYSSPIARSPSIASTELPAGRGRMLNQSTSPSSVTLCQDADRARWASRISH